MKWLINKLKAELKIQEASNEISKGQVYDLTSKEWYQKQVDCVEDYKKAIDVLEKLTVQNK